jgi:hypothetical protein
MHLPPPNVATSVLAQKLSEPLPCVNVQHLLLFASVQSAFCLQRRSFWVPVQVAPSVVGHCAEDRQATVGGSSVQLGAWPPVMWMLAQQTFPAQSAGLEHAKPASPPAPESPPEELLVLPLPLPLLLLPLPLLLLPLPLPLLLPLPLPLLLVLLPLPLPLPLLPLPVLLPLLLPLPLLPLPLLPLPLPEELPSGVAEPLHATNSETNNAADARRANIIGTSRCSRIRAAAWQPEAYGTSLNTSHLHGPEPPGQAA